MSTTESMVGLSINNAEKKGNCQGLIRPCSKVIIQFLTVTMEHGYLAEFEIIDDHRARKSTVNLTGRLNKILDDHTTISWYLLLAKVNEVLQVQQQTLRPAKGRERYSP
ncbi:hypothetical protein A6R68_12726 [Neotoma lepida]|uniref:40S ribosomal protein S15a n=1 Tax=Neotoma lepida TaxID=56216 RepID=A0A1A6H278_NEOLE|nr:hypothetical protein A6R68_12726 [Neotoma lepida]